MNELAYHPDKYFAMLELQEMLAVEGMGLSKDITGMAWEGQNGRCAACDRHSLGEPSRKGSRAAWRTHCSKPINAGVCEVLPGLEVH